MLKPTIRDFTEGTFILLQSHGKKAFIIERGRDDGGLEFTIVYDFQSKKVYAFGAEAVVKREFMPTPEEIAEVAPLYAGAL